MSIAGQHVTSRRDVIQAIAFASAALSLPKALCAAAVDGQESSGARPLNAWIDRAGLELFTVRDLLKDARSYETVCAQIAGIGYKEIEPAIGYGGMDPKAFRAMLDRYGLSMPSTHSGATEGPGLEKQLEGFQIMGIKYAEISAPRAGGFPGAAPGGPRRTPGQMPQMRPQTSDEVKRMAELLNQHGESAKKFGMKILVHNHTMEFMPLSDHPEMCPYDIILANTDPSLVVMQIDIGWAIQAGQDPLAMFKKNPGRYELWHVKDMNDIKTMPPNSNEAERMQMGVRAIVPVGLGDIDYKPIFEAASLAGLKHYCIEQDSAATWGDSMAAARVCYDNLKKLLAS